MSAIPDVVLFDAYDGFEQKINSWLPPNQAGDTGKQVKSIKLESAIQAAFALKMPLDYAELFLRRCWLDALYMRDVKDVIYRCGLKCGFSYGDVEALIDEFSELDKPNPDPATGENLPDGDVTKMLVRELDREYITCPDDVRSFIRANEGLFGSYRRRTHKKFIELYNQIKSGIEEKSEVADAIDRLAEARHRELIMSEGGYTKIGVRKTISQDDLLIMLSTGLSDLKKAVRKGGPGGGLAAVIRKHVIENIPGHGEWSEIINRTPDRKTGAIRGIDRKLMMLVWLSSDDGNTDIFAGRPETTPERALENHVMSLNEDILQEYGFPTLDPRHPFDWAIMNTLYLAHIYNKGIDGTDIPVRLENLFKQLR